MPETLAPTIERPTDTDSLRRLEEGDSGWTGLDPAESRRIGARLKSVFSDPQPLANALYFGALLSDGIGRKAVSRDALAAGAIIMFATDGVQALWEPAAKQLENIRTKQPLEYAKILSGLYDMASAVIPVGMPLQTIKSIDRSNHDPKIVKLNREELGYGGYYALAGSATNLAAFARSAWERTPVPSDGESRSAFRRGLEGARRAFGDDESRNKIVDSLALFTEYYGRKHQLPWHVIVGTGVLLGHRALSACWANYKQKDVPYESYVLSAMKVVGAAAYTTTVGFTWTSLKEIAHDPHTLVAARADIKRGHMSSWTAAGASFIAAAASTVSGWRSTPPPPAATPALGSTTNSPRAVPGPGLAAAPEVANPTASLASLASRRDISPIIAPTTPQSGQAVAPGAANSTASLASLATQHDISPIIAPTTPQRTTSGTPGAPSHARAR
ncbi:hypothetical protein [Micromonospora sp. WMMD710]|uniref:hypothetical protein n=1 Tax=Micromonospora sp. WMMD710 TaxID=3016085 RepID=UPI002415F608|nr:hypothetical protein [Micromonospora sp. WMMD710]MDG4758848.1 hypothetical protein [Micromonospora sp. WMMD710]